jgi:signal transduction histidine kinase
MRIDHFNWRPETWRIARPRGMPRAEAWRLEPRALAIYAHMMTRLQRDMLLLMMGLTIPIGLFFSVQLFHNAWLARTMPPAAFFVHTADVGLSVLLASYFLWRGKVAAAWASVLSVSLGVIMAQIWLLREPGLLLFALLSMAGPAITMSARITVALVGGLVAALFLIVSFSFPAYSDAWISIAILYAAIALGFGCIGVVIRRFVRRFAQTTVEIEDAAAQRGKLEQRMDDLNRQIGRIASLEHDLRQPLRAVQGYLATLSAEAPNADELITPALAAARRADRLINNLLDQARAEAHQQRTLRAPLDLARFFAALERTAPGLASYYTDPPVPIEFALAERMPAVAIDSEQLERAILNLLDNALAYSPPDGLVAVHAWATDTDLMIEVRDMGPGLPDAVTRALFAGAAPDDGPRPGLGLRQVHSMAQAHGGKLSVDSSADGTTVRIILPLMTDG